MNDGSLDSCLRLVANRHRRSLLEHLRHKGTGEIGVDDLVDQMHPAVAGTAGDPEMSRDQLAVQLHHTHLPKLANHGVVEHNLDRGTTTYRPDKQIEAVLDGLPEEPSLINP